MEGEGFPDHILFLVNIPLTSVYLNLWERQERMRR